MKNIKRLISIVAIVLVIGFLLPQNNVMASEQVNHLVLDARNGVVKVTFYLKDAAYYAVAKNGKLYPLEDIGDMHYSSGTGFFIGEEGEDPEFLVTNEHVVDEYVQADYGKTFIFDTGEIYTDDDVEYPVVVGAPNCELRIYYSDEDYDVAVVDTPGDVEREDLALLRLKDGTTDKRTPMKLKILEGDVTTTPVYALGFPGLLENSFTESSKYQIGDITVEPGQITHEPKTDANGVERFPVSAIIRHGNSGGPLVTEDGYVVGVNTNGISMSDNSEQSYYSISSKTLSRFLERANAKFEIADGSGETTGTDDSAEPDKEDPEEGDSEAQTGEETSSEDDVTATDSNRKMLPVIIGAAVVVILGIAIFALTRKKAETENRSTEVSPQPSSPTHSTTKRAMLRSLSTQHNGMTVAVHAGSQVMIGRDPANCKVVFREGTEGISGRHCAVSYDEASNEFILTDLRSTYGTFLKNGQKLNPNVPYRLKAGDEFYVGDKANSFRVELG